MGSFGGGGGGVILRRCLYLDYTASDHEVRIGKYLEGSGRSLFEVLYRNFPGKIKEK
jgi:hypothetical protein